MGQYVGKHIARIVSGYKSARPFEYRHQGDLATIGKKSAVVAFNRTKLKGVIGWLVCKRSAVALLIGA
jgi:NADH dehydrogenase